MPDSYTVLPYSLLYSCYKLGVWLHYHIQGYTHSTSWLPDSYTVLPYSLFTLATSLESDYITISRVTLMLQTGCLIVTMYYHIDCYTLATSYYIQGYNHATSWLPDSYNVLPYLLLYSCYKLWAWWLYCYYIQGYCTRATSWLPDG